MKACKLMHGYNSFAKEVIAPKKVLIQPKAAEPVLCLDYRPYLDLFDPARRIFFYLECSLQRTGARISVHALRASFHDFRPPSRALTS